MVINLIVAAALVLGGGYLVLWMLSPRLRKNIERPKYLFQEKLNEYHKQLPDNERNEINPK